MTLVTFQIPGTTAPPINYILLGRVILIETFIEIINMIGKFVLALLTLSVSAVEVIVVKLHDCSKRAVGVVGWRLIAAGQRRKVEISRKRIEITYC